MKGTPIYQQIAESVRQEIAYGRIGPGDRLPTVREMAERWSCTPGTVQRAYRELAHQGLVSGRPGQGTTVTAALPPEDGQPLRQATLVHQTEAFVLETLAAGYTEAELERAMRVALDRWRSLSGEPGRPAERGLRFVGTHDPAIALIENLFADVAPGGSFRATFAGSLGGLIALAEGAADLAGTHLWDEESDSYNLPFVRRLLPGRRLALITLAHRRLGLIARPGDPHGISGLESLSGSGLRFVNRQRGAGTRVWLDVQLQREGIDPALIVGYDVEAPTHSEVARAISSGEADVGLGVEAAALALGLAFIPLVQEPYSLVVPEAVWDAPAVQMLVGWLATSEAREAIAALGGYDTSETGTVTWVG
jgi:molybdate-binding protein/DNA-binding transcriptional regulator YhcF (GntR family)